MEPTTIQYQEEEKEETSKKNKTVRQSTRRNLDALPQKAKNLYSDNVEEMIEAASYFRKVLATGAIVFLELISVAFLFQSHNIMYYLDCISSNN